MAKGKDTKFRRKFYSLYLDTLAVLMLFLLLVLVVWLSLRPTPVLEARQTAKSVASLSTEEREQQKDKFVVRYITAPELTAANNPELIAFGSHQEQGGRNTEIYYAEQNSGNSLAAPRKELESPKLLDTKENITIADNSFLTIDKPELPLGQALNTQTKSNSVDSLDATAKAIPYVYWSLPSTIPMSSMPNIEPIMRKYGWLSGNLDVILTIGEEGFVSNVVVCSEDIVEPKLLRELKGKLLSLHLGKQNSNIAVNIGVSWNLP